MLDLLLNVGAGFCLIGILCLLALLCVASVTTAAGAFAYQLVNAVD